MCRQTRPTASGWRRRSPPGGAGVANPLRRSTAPAHAAAAEPARGAARNAASGRDDPRSSRSRTYHPVEGEKLPREPWTFSAVMRGRLGGAACGAPASPLVLPRQGRARVDPRRRRRDVPRRGHEPRADPFLHPGRKGFVQVPGAEALGFVGELHPLTARRTASRIRSSAWSSISTASASAWARLHARNRSRSSRRCARTSPSIVPDEHAASEVLAARAPRAGSCSVTSRCSTSGATPRHSAPAAAHWRCG